MIQLNKFFLSFFVLCFIFSFNLFSLNTSNARGSNTVYALTPQEVYSASNDVWGFVTYQDGFSVNSSVTLGLGLASPIKGGEIKLSDGSVLELLTDLDIGSTLKFTIGTSGGDTAYFIGNEGVLLCDNGLNIPDNRNLKFIESNAIIDCKGNYLNIGSGSQLIVDSGVTLTLRNMILTGLYGNASGVGGISFVDNSSALCLQNVIIDLQNDYDLDQGWLFIHDDVWVWGDGFKFKRSSIYDYPNQKPIVIANESWLNFERNSIFEYDYCSSVTTQCRENLIFKDTSSVLRLSDAVLSVPSDLTNYSGLFLKNGSLILENKVTFSNYTCGYVNNDPQKGIIWGNVQDTSGMVNLNLKALSDVRVEIFGSLVVTKANFV
ncbi:MAG: hypothetical protein ABIA74_02995 [bacterium]